MSRLSMASTSVTSSCLSLTSTTSDKSKQEAKSESLFPRRWQDEREMDRSLKILKRKQAATVRLRKMNSVADRILEGRVRDLNSHFTRLSRQLRKETNFIQDEIKEINSLRFLPRIDSVVRSAPDSRESMKTESLSFPSRSVSRTSREPMCTTCLFDPENTRWRCKHFPCYLPVTYHSIGYFDTVKTYSKIGSYDKFLQRCNDLRPATSSVTNAEADSDQQDEEIDLESRAPRTTTKEKIRGLRQLVKEMKQANEKQKPRDWATNYGDPIPRRILLKPVKT